MNIELDGIKWHKDRSGYYYSSRLINGKRLCLHRYVYEKHYGKIPEGYEVHHVDFNKDNNNIDNLIIMTYSAHRRLHNKTSKFLIKRIATNKDPEVVSKIQSKLNVLRTTYVDSDYPCVECGNIFKVSLMKKSEQKTCGKKCYFKNYNRNRNSKITLKKKYFLPYYNNSRSHF